MFFVFVFFCRGLCNSTTLLLVDFLGQVALEAFCMSSPFVENGLGEA